MSGPTHSADELRGQPPCHDSVYLQLLRELMHRSGRAYLRVQGTSMLPSIWPGEIVEVVKASTHDLTVGDVLLLQRGNRLFCHRLVRVQTHSGALFTQGDFLGRQDPPFVASELLGRVRGYRRAWYTGLAVLALRLLRSTSERAFVYAVGLRSLAGLRNHPLG